MDQQTLLVTRQSLINDFGNLSDLPHELANTIANVYYRYCALADVPDRHFRSIDDSIAAIAELERVQTEFEFARKVVAQLRDLRQKAHPSLVAVSSELFLSILKYRIDDAMNKSPIRLMFERFLHRHKVSEIPRLIDALRL